MGRDSALTWFLEHSADASPPYKSCGPGCPGAIAIESLLHVAFNAKNFSAVIILLSHGASLTYTTHSRGNLHAMTEAIEHGSVSVVDYLVIHRHVDVDDPELAPLHLAAQLGQDAILTYLLDHDASIDLESSVHNRSWVKSTALDAAMCVYRDPRESTAMILISRGASLEYQDSFHNPYHEYRNWFRDCDDRKTHALVQAVKYNTLGVIDHLVTTLYMDLNNPEIGVHTAAFNEAVVHCWGNCLEKLLDLGLNPNGPGTTWKESHLHRELSSIHPSGSFEVCPHVSALVNAGASVTSTSTPPGTTEIWNPTPIHDMFLINHDTHAKCGCYSVHILVLKVLIEAGVDVNLCASNYNYVTPLDAAFVEVSSLDMVLTHVLDLVKAGAQMKRKHLFRISSRLRRVQAQRPIKTQRVRPGDEESHRGARVQYGFGSALHEMKTLFSYLAQSAVDIVGVSKEVLEWAMVQVDRADGIFDNDWTYPQQLLDLSCLQRDFWVAIIHIVTSRDVTLSHLRDAYDQQYCEEAHSRCQTLIDLSHFCYPINDLPGREVWKWMERG
ncbi:unnamed protein product [Discula destructiva]